MKTRYSGYESLKIHSIGNSLMLGVWVKGGKRWLGKEEEKEHGQVERGTVGTRGHPAG